MSQKKIYEIDGYHFSTLEEFYDEISRVLIPGAGWGCNLDAFNDILRGGFGTPEEGFVLRWNNSRVSRDRLGARLYGDIVEIIKDHCARGDQSQDGVELILD